MEAQARDWIEERRREPVAEPAYGDVGLGDRDRRGEQGGLDARLRLRRSKARIPQEDFLRAQCLALRVHVGTGRPDMNIKGVGPPASPTPAHTSQLPLLPSGPGGICCLALRGNRQGCHSEPLTSTTGDGAGGAQYRACQKKSQNDVARYGRYRL